MPLKKYMNLKKTLISGSILVIAASFASSGFNYLYQLVCLKFLNIKDYGVFQSLFSLNYLIGVLISSYGLTIVYFISHSKPNQIKSIINHINNLTFKIAVLFSVFLIIISPIFYKFFNLDISFFLYLVFIIQVFISFFASNYQSILQGLLKFKELSISTLILSIGKIIFTIIFVVIGFKTIGAIGGLIAGAVLQIIFSKLSIQKINKPKSKTDLKLKINHTFLNFLFFSTIVNFCLISLFSTDILLVKKFFSYQEVGIYSAASILGRIIFFASSMINIVVFPLFVKNKNKKIFLYSFIYLVITSLFVNLIFKFFPQYSILPLTNQNYSAVINIIPSFCVFFTIYSLYSLICQFLLSQKNRLLVFPVVISFLLQIILISLNHQNLIEIINQSIYSLIPGLLITIYLLFTKRKDYFFN
jgi:O-antigen/teichoic acid export membrane protein